MNNEQLRTMNTNELPLFMQPNGDAEIDRLQKEMDVYLSLLNANPAVMLCRTFVHWNPSEFSTDCLCEEDVERNNAFIADPQTRKDIDAWLFSKKHKCDGKSWNCGFMGSRWADVKINGKLIRACFYSNDKLTDKSYRIMFCFL